LGKNWQAICHGTEKVNLRMIKIYIFLHRILRHFFEFLPENFVFPALLGPLRGMRWVAHSAGMGCMAGIYEKKPRRVFRDLIKKNDIVFDVGAHVGFYTLLASKRVGKNGRVFSFEPLPRNIFFLKKHISLNNLRNVEIMEFALSDKEDHVFFDTSIDSFQGRIAVHGNIKVYSTTLDRLVNERDIPPPNVLKIDVEGEEYNLLRGGEKILARYKPKILLSVHSHELRDKCSLFLKNLGYDIEFVTPVEFVAKPL